MKPESTHVTLQAHAIRSTNRSAQEARGTKQAGRDRTAPPALRKELLAKLVRLRSATKEVGRSYLANLEHDIVELTELIDGTGEGKDGKRTLKVSAIERMEEILEDVSIKPEKGRRRDLRRIEKAVRAMEQVLSKRKR